VNPKSLGLGFGIITACLNIGVLAGPYFTGLARDFTGNYGLSFQIMALFAVLQAITIGLFALLKLKK